MARLGFMVTILGILLAISATGCSLVVDFDRSLLLDSGVDAGVDPDAGLDASVDLAVDFALDAEVDPAVDASDEAR